MTRGARDSGRSRDGVRIATLLIVVTLVAAACGSDSAAEGESTAVPSTQVPATSTSTTTTSTTTSTSTTTTIPVIAAPPPIPIEPPDGYELIWNDEFDGDTIDPANWTYDIGGWGWGNGESQYYTDRADNAWLQDGLLVIEGRQERFEESYYTSTRLKTQGLQEFQYGYFEARIKVPEGQGMWPAFWMLGADFGRDTEDPNASNWPDVGEIDIMEYVGKEPLLVYGTLHGPGYAGAGRSGQSVPQRRTHRRQLPHVCHRMGRRGDPLVLRRRDVRREEPGHRRRPMGLRQAVLLHPQSGAWGAPSRDRSGWTSSSRSGSTSTTCGSIKRSMARDEDRGSPRRINNGR